jgi:hypothetical protein
MDGANDRTCVQGRDGLYMCVCDDKQVQLDVGGWVGSQCAISRGGSGLHKSIISVNLNIFRDIYLIPAYTVGLLHKWSVWSHVFKNY